MDHEMIERCCLALEQRFKNTIAETAGMSFEETKVSLPNRDIWKKYTLTIIKAMREPTKKMELAGSLDPGSGGPDEGYETEVWQAMLDCIIGD